MPSILEAMSGGLIILALILLGLVLDWWIEQQ